MILSASWIWIYLKRIVFFFSDQLIILICRNFKETFFKK